MWGRPDCISNPGSLAQMKISDFFKSFTLTYADVLYIEHDNEQNELRMQIDMPYYAQQSYVPEDWGIVPVQLVFYGVEDVIAEPPLSTIAWSEKRWGEIADTSVKN